MFTGKLRLHNRIKETSTLGPGKRFALWFQGCEKKCKDCMSPSATDMQKGFVVSIDAIASEIYSCPYIEGVTISGGEPFLQYEGLYELLRRIKSNTQLGVIIYTGYYLGELQKMQIPEVTTIINELADIIIDGPYINELNDGICLRGSSNQSVHLLTSRYKDLYDDYYNRPERKVEIHLSYNELLLVGIPDAKSFEMWNKKYIKTQG